MLSGFAVTDSPLVIVMPAALLGGGLLIMSPAFRLAFIVLGGMIVFQSSEGFSAIKAAYILGVGLALFVAVMTTRHLSQTTAFDLLRPLNRLAVVAIVGLLLTAFVANQNGITTTNWIRDVTTYVLLASVPVVALDVQRIRSARVLEWMLVSFGLLSAVSVGLAWAAARGYLELPIDRLLLATGSPAHALVLYAFARYLGSDRQEPRWLLYIGLVTALLVLTGSRSAFLPYVGLIPVLFILERSTSSGVGRNMRRSIGAILGVICTFAVLLFAIAQAGVVDLAGLSARYERSGILISNPSADASFVERSIQLSVAWNTFLDHPVFGTGPGHLFEIYRPTRGVYSQGLVIDTTMSVPAKFGILGTLCLVLAGLLLWQLALRARKVDSGRVVAATVFGWLLYTMASLPLLSVFEDKGYSLALMALLATGLRQAETGGFPRD